jgi:hypothetical protein
MQNENKSKNAIYCYSGYGPTFGDGFDNCIVSYSNTTYGSYSDLGSSYNHPQYAQGTNEAESFLAGSFEFHMNEIEVYEKE